MDVERDRPNNRFNDGKIDRRGRHWADDGRRPLGPTLPAL
jgi:sugar lactone lactonase YvrE